MKKGAGRAYAELENSIWPDSAPENLQAQSGWKLLCVKKGAGRAYAELE
ncbi:MAG: hypothetical protein HFI01_10625 [Lachnospiraceae bacterium]|nr:hypothetical protein [Lachnospiraceae bacterium]